MVIFNYLFRFFVGALAYFYPQNAQVADSQSCSSKVASIPEGASWAQAFREPVSNPRIIDISLDLSSETVQFESDEGLGPDFRTLIASQAKQDRYTGSFLKLPAHTGTHVDSPGHFILQAYESGVGVESIRLHALNGPVLVTEVSVDKNITAEVLQQLHIPPGVTRVIFKTANTHRRLLHSSKFHTDYTAMTEDGARWLLGHTSIHTIGIDYLSVATYSDVVTPHVLLLGQGKVVVEGLVLDSVAVGLYNMHCLPLKVVGADGAPARCILTTLGQ